MTPAQLRIVTLIGAKQVHEDEFSENPTLALTWVSEALELLLLLEIERAAIEDGVTVDGLIEAVKETGAAEMLAAAQEAKARPC